MEAQTVFHAAKTCIAALTEEADRLRTGGRCGARAAAALRAAGELRALLRDRLLSVPACAAAADADAGCCCCCGGGGSDGAGGSGSQPCGGAAQAAVSTTGACASGGQELAARRRRQRAAAAARTLGAMAAWHAGLDADLKALISSASGEDGAAAAAAEAEAQPGGREEGGGGGGGSGACSVAPLNAPALARTFARRRHAADKAELANAAAALRRLLRPPPRARAAALLEAIAALRRAEETLGFHSRLARAAAAAAAEAADASHSTCSQAAAQRVDGEGSFAYGSTPLASWLELFLQPAVWRAVQAAMGGACGGGDCSSGSGSGSEGACEGGGSKRAFMVWGSSLGWLVLYAALALGWAGPCRGVELLPCLVDEARRVAAALGVEGGWAGGGGALGRGTWSGGRRRKPPKSRSTPCADPGAPSPLDPLTMAAGRAPAPPGVGFECGDLRASRLEGVGVLHLTEQCWDKALVEQVRARRGTRRCSGLRGLPTPPRPSQTAALTVARPAPQAVSKAAAELAPGSVVVDYTGAAVRRLAAAGAARVLGVAPARVSWGAAQLHAAVVLARGGGGGGGGGEP
jgi:hypothetical protein